MLKTNQPPRNERRSAKHQHCVAVRLKSKTAVRRATPRLPETDLTDRPAIAHVLHRLDFAGAEVLAAQIARSLSRRYRFVFFVLDGVGPLGEQLRAEQFEVVHLHRKPGVDRRAMRAMRNAITQHHIQLLHAHQYTPFFYAATGRGLRQRKRLPILFTEHGRHTPDQRSTKRILANRFLLAPRDRVTAVSKFITQALIDNEAIPAKRIQTLYNGITPAPGTSDRVNDRSTARAALGIENNIPLVMQVARFHPVKDHATALHAWHRVHQHLPSAKLLLLGQGPTQNEMQTLAQTLNLGDAVRFVGQVPDVRALLPAANVAMLSSLSEGLSVTLLEAMAASLPIAATDVGGNPELVIPHETGLLAPREDPEALATHLITLLNDPALQNTMGAAGQARFQKHFTAHQMHASYEKLYQTLLPTPTM